MGFVSLEGDSVDERWGEGEGTILRESWFIAGFIGTVIAEVAKVWLS